MVRKLKMQKNNVEFEIGQKIMMAGSDHVLVVEEFSEKKGGCKRCYFEKMTDCSQIESRMGDCDAAHRTDKTGIVFRKLNFIEKAIELLKEKFSGKK